MEIDPGTVAIVVAALGAIGGLVFAGARAGAEQAAKVAIDNANWPVKIGQELQKIRGTERQELRYAAYGGLWKKQRPLAMYRAGADEHTAFGQKEAAELLNAQSDWYFDEAGGLLLTAIARQFYFTWQELLQSVAEKPGWNAERSNTDSRLVFLALLEADGRGKGSRKLDGALTTMDYFKGNTAPEDWPEGAGSLGSRWKEEIKTIPEAWHRLTPEQRFAVLQQVSSTMRTVLTYDVESRIR